MWESLRKAQAIPVSDRGSQINYIVDDEIHHGNAITGRARVRKLRELVESAIDMGELSDDSIDTCLAFLNDVRRLRIELEKDAAKFADSAVILEAAQDYADLASLLEELLSWMVTESLAALSSGLNAIEDQVQIIDAKLDGPPPESTPVYLANLV